MQKFVSFCETVHKKRVFLKQFLHPSQTETRCYRNFFISYFWCISPPVREMTSWAHCGSAPDVILPEQRAIIAHASTISAENKTRWENKHHSIAMGVVSVKGRPMTHLTLLASLHLLKIYIFGKIFVYFIVKFSNITSAKDRSLRVSIDIWQRLTQSEGAGAA